MSDLRVERFRREAEANGTRVEVVESEAAAVELVRALIGDRRALVDPVGVLAGLDWPDPPADPWDAEVGVTSAYCAAAESGTVALLLTTRTPRRTSLLVHTSVVLVPLAMLLATYQDAVDAVAAVRPVPIGVQFVSGHSRSGDIEGAMIHGMHGPADLVVIVHP